MERTCGAGKALSGSDAGGAITKRKTRRTCWHGGEQEGHAEKASKSIKRRFLRNSRSWRSKGHKKPWNSCTRSISSQSGKGRRKGKSENGAKFGRIEAIKHWNDARGNVSVEMCSHSIACDREEVCSDYSRKMQDKEETTCEASWTAVTKGKPEGEAEACLSAKHCCLFFLLPPANSDALPTFLHPASNSYRFCSIRKGHALPFAESPSCSFRISSSTAVLSLASERQQCFADR